MDPPKAARNRKKKEKPESTVIATVTAPRLAKPAGISHHHPPQPKAEAKPPRPTKEPCPNYMKPTENYKARMEFPEVPKVGNALRRRSSIRPMRPTRKVTPGKKNSSNKAEVTQEATATSPAGKVCAYSRCSLNAHEHPPAPKHAFLMRKVSVNAQKSFRVRGGSSSSTVSRRRGTWKIESKSDSGGRTSASSSKQPLSDKHDREDGAAGEQMTHPDSCSSFGEQHDPESEFSNSDVDSIIATFLDTFNSDAEAESKEQKFHLTSAKETIPSISGCDGETAEFFEDEPCKATEICEEEFKHEQQSIGNNESFPDIEFWAEDSTYADAVIEGNEHKIEAGYPIPSPEEYRGLCMENIAEKAEDIIHEAEEYLEMDLELPGEEEGHIEGSEEDDIEAMMEEYLFGESTTPTTTTEPLSEANRRMEARLSIKKNLIKKCFEKLRTIRQLRMPERLSMIEEQNRQRIELRQMMMGMMCDRKDAEEWMVDYKLRHLIDQLARAQKRKVQLLVEAYESIMHRESEASD